MDKQQQDETWRKNFDSAMISLLRQVGRYTHREAVLKASQYADLVVMQGLVNEYYETLDKEIFAF
jgi:hypothetical protein